jgi:NAD-dependent protein deacetylase/lipoamidase
MNTAITAARQLIGAARNIVAFTGAGVSAESGIPTYRGDGGLWTEYDPNKYADINYFKKDPTYYWKFFRDIRYRALVDSAPNEAHIALATLEKTGQGGAIITQNIDGLHQAAGSTEVIELHGNTRRFGCLNCDADYKLDIVSNKVKQELPPTCDHCGGILKPRVIFFGESLPQEALKRGVQVSAECDLMLIVGSSLAVYPAASLPLLAKRGGAQIIIINVGPTAMDEIADIRIDAKAGETLPTLIGNNN